MKRFIPDSNFQKGNGVYFPKIMIYKSGKLNFKNYKTTSDFQKFINYFSISCPREFSKDFPGLYNRLCYLKLCNSVSYERRILKDLSIFNSLDDFQNFIDTHQEITCPKDFKNISQGLYSRAIDLGFSKDLTYKNKRKNYESYQTLEEFQEFINSHSEIKSANDFYRVNQGLYRRASRLGYSKKLRYPSNRGWLDINSADDIINLIKREKVLNSEDLKRRFHGVLKRARKLGIKPNEYNSHFLKPRKSYLEILVYRFLKKNNIDFKDEEKFTETGKLRFDFWLPKYSLMLEPGGEQHLVPVDQFGGDEYLRSVQQHDQQKRDFCKSKNIKILYWFHFSPEYREEAEKVLELNGYPGEYYLDFDEYTNRILELIKT